LSQSVFLRICGYSGRVYGMAIGWGRGLERRTRARLQTSNGDAPEPNRSAKRTQILHSVRDYAMPPFTASTWPVT
jgi:hypothetical protein